MQHPNCDAMVSSPQLSTRVDAPSMRRAMGAFATGVAVITTISQDGKPQGMTINSVTSVSLDPPILLVCLTNDARTSTAVINSGQFAISILGTRQERIARLFAARGENHFAGLPLTFGRHYVPVIPDAVAHLECTVENSVAVGDHIVVFGNVQRTCSRDGLPLLFLRGQFGDYIDRGHEPVTWFF